jgi:hypothetical protein
VIATEHHGHLAISQHISHKHAQLFTDSPDLREVFQLLIALGSGFWLGHVDVTEVFDIMTELAKLFSKSGITNGAWPHIDATPALSKI